MKEAPQFVDDAKRVLELSWTEAQRLGHQYIATKQLLLGILRKRDCVAVKIKQELGVDFDELEKRVMVGVVNDSSNQ